LRNPDIDPSVTIVTASPTLQKYPLCSLNVSSFEKYSVNFSIPLV